MMMMPPSKEAINFQNDSFNDNNNIMSKNNSSKLGNRHKNKPLPLVIPSDISSFAFQQQQQQQQLQNSLNYSLNNNSQHSIPYFHQMSANPSTSSSHQYPSYTLLKSPRLALQNDLKKQYTPPPMLSPFRKGPGLYYKYFANMFLLPNAATAAAAAAAAAASLNSQSQFNHHHQQLLHQNLLNSTASNRPPLFNHSMSCSHIYPPTQSNFYNSSNFKSDLNKENNASFISEDTEEAPHLNDLSEGCDETNNLKDNIEEEDDNHESSCSEVDQKSYNNKTISNDQTQEEKENNVDDQDEISIKNLKEHVLTNNNEVNIKQQLKRPRLSKIK